MSALPSTSRLLAFARDLQRARTFHELLEITRAEITAALGYHNAWLFVADSEDAGEVRLIDVSGGKEAAVWESAPVLKIAGDSMLEEIFASDAPVVVEDARTDPRTNKEIVAVLGNRTIVNVPLRLLDKPFGAFGTGTFGDEGVRPPSQAQLDYLIGMGGQLAVAAGRIRFLEEREQSAAALRRAEEQLRQAQKLEAVGRLAGGVAHDFNNLLSVILSYSSMLLHQLPDGAPMRAEIAQIERAGERAAELTKQLLAFARQRVTEPVVIDVNHSLAEMDAMLRRLAGPRVSLRIDAAPDVGRVRVDGGQLDQIVVNLAVNARDAMPHGGELTISTAGVDDPPGLPAGRYVSLRVTDTGVGMDEAVQKRIFEPFFTTKPKGKGTGLGLPTVYGIVTQSGGAIRVRSAPGAGTTMEVLLPRTDAAVTPVGPTVAVESLRGTETILLVDDDDLVRNVARRILESHGYRVIAASGAEEALRLSDAEPGPIPLLVSDVVMPEMDGRELAKRLLATRPQLRCLFVSGYHEAPLSGDALGPVLQKPITPDALLRRVRERLDA
jgi:two-component system cell cycle sensor histidine kinase/response regulator CckA